MSLSDLSSEVVAKRPRPVRGKRRTQAERTQETRTRILDAAVEVLRRKGYAHFRTADVARAAGVSRGAQLHHFATKEKLVYATMEHVFQNVLETSRKRVRGLQPGEDPLERAIDDAREFFFSTPFFISLDIATSINNVRFRNRLMAMVRAARLPAEQAWRQALMERGMPEREADDLLWLTLALVRGLAVRMLWQNEPARFDRLLKVWRGVVESHLSTAPPPMAAKGRSARRQPCKA